MYNSQPTLSSRDNTVKHTWQSERPIATSYQCCAAGFRNFNSGYWLDANSRNLCQKSNCIDFVSLCSPSAPVPRTVFFQSFGRDTTENFTAASELPICHSSTTTKKKFSLSSVCSLSQATACWCSSLASRTSQMMNSAPCPAA